MNLKNKIFVIGMIFIIFSSILISAANSSIEENNSEKILEKKILLETNQTSLPEEISGTINISTESNSTNENSTQLINLEELFPENITVTKKTKNDDEEAPSSSSPTQEKEIKEEINATLEEKIISISLYKEGKKEIEGEIPESFEGEIKKTESVIDENTKEVIVKSDEHLESELIVYTNIKETGNKKDISIYWKNEEKEISIKEYFDENNNGLIDRISWVVPHLSEQIFMITVVPTIVEGSSEILLDVTNVDTSTNPVIFEISLNYSNLVNLRCELNISNSTNLISQSSFDSFTTGMTEFSIGNSFDLGIGTKNWYLFCWDISNSSRNATDSGDFLIEEKTFSITTPRQNYLQNEDVPFNLITPENSGISRLILTTPTGILSPDLPSSSTEIISNVKILPGNYLVNVSNDYYEKPMYRNFPFYVAHTEILVNKSTASINEPIKITLVLNSPTKQINYLRLDTTDGNINNDYYLTPKNTENIVLTHSYSQAGTYQPTLNFTIDGTTFSVKSPPITVSDPSTTNQAPVVTLIYPKDKELIKDDRVNFKYKATDDKKINSCAFELYVGSGEWKTRDYAAPIDYTIINDEEIEVKLTAFEDGNYSWTVECIDNESKRTEEIKSFIIQTSKHEHEEEIDEAINALEGFMKKENSLTLDEKNALDELGITEDLKYYSKRLIQIDQDLGNNLKFITDLTLREKRTEETVTELKEIIQNIPKSIKIVDSTEYIKNSFTANMEEITKNYAEGKNIQINPKEIRNLAEENIKIQPSLSISVKIKKIEIEYKEKTKKIISINKEIDLKDKTFKTILEQIPSKFEEIQFKTQSKELTKNLFEIKLEEVKDNKIIYYIEEDVDLNDLKNTETVLFEELPRTKGSITGYFSAPLSGRNNTLYVLAFIVFLFAAIYFGKDIFKKMQMNLWKKEENVRRILEYSEKAKKSLQSDDQEIAKEYYHKIKEIYSLVPEGFRTAHYPIIQKIRIGIDRREMMIFVKEYETAKREKRNEDSKRLYKNIQDQYKRLPQKYQQKVYDRVIKEQMKEEFNL